MRRLVLAFGLVVGALALSGAGQPAPPPHPHLSAADRADLDRVSAYLNGIHSMKGSFVQIDASGQLEQGEFYLKKPGRIRFEYQPPDPTLVVADGHTVAVVNKKLKTVNRYPLSATPLDLLLSDDIDLKANSAVTGVEHQPGALVVEARSSDRRAQGDISLVFADPGLELRQWTVIDAQGQSTTVALRNVQQGVAIPGSIFTVHEKLNPFAAKHD